MLAVNNLFRTRPDRQENPYVDFINIAYDGIHQTNKHYYQQTSDQK
ncbi:MAG: hypothetical protein LIP01_00290 [Tannerellaceae bacterium]|nr:hypothetical protein [Tannerellaceae bacterium]